MREDKYAVTAVRASAGEELDAVESLRDALQAEPELVIVFGDSVKGEAVRTTGGFRRVAGHSGEVLCLVDYSNSRGAVDMGLLPDCCPVTGLGGWPDV